MANWSRVLNTTIREYVRKEEVNILRNRKLLAMMREKGRITFNHSGTMMDWKVRYKRAPMLGYTDGDTITFARRDRWKTASLPWRGYSISDAMTKGEQLQNKSTEAIIKVYSGMAERLMEDLEDQFPEQLYVDGNLSQNAKGIHGVESFMYATQNPSNSLTGTAVANDTYAGLSTALGAYGGNWTGVWPDGKGDANYDFWTPIIVDYGAPFFSGTDTWLANCYQALRYGIIYGKRNKSLKGQVDTVITDVDMYRQWLSILDTKERVLVQRNADRSVLVKLGWEDVQNFEGCDVTSEYGIPQGVGYGWNFDELELASLQDNLFVPEMTDYDVSTKSWRFSVDMFGNLKMNPKFFVKWAKYS